MKLTLQSLKTTHLPEKGFTRIWDKEVLGFHVRLYASGRRSFRYSFRQDGRKKDYCIGANLNLHDARKIALQLAAKVANGLDLQEEKRRNKPKV